MQGEFVMTCWTDVLAMKKQDRKNWASSCSLVEYSVVANNLMVGMANNHHFEELKVILEEIEKARY